MKCPKCGFEWQRNANVYTRSNYCGVCGYDGTEGSEDKNREKIKKHPMVTFKMANPEAAEFWDYEKNDPNKSPDSVLMWSGYEAYFTCNKGHSFRKPISHMFRRKDGKPLGCPHCKKEKHRWIEAIIGVNDFFTKCPEAKDFWDYSANTEIDPTKEFVSSPKKAVFVCKHGHRRYTSLKLFAESPECFQCRKSVAAHEKDIKFWDYDKNVVSPWDVPIKDNDQELYWRCVDCGFEWKQSARNRHIRKGKCPRCGVKNLSMPTDKSLLPFSEYIPKISELWISSRNKEINPDNVTGMSEEYITLRCPNNPKHIYEIQIRKIKPNPPYGCPYCLKHEVFPGEDFFSVVPEAKTMWDYEKNTGFGDTAKIKPWSLAKVYFHCDKGHSFTRKIAGFTRNPTCPECVREGRMAKETVADIPHLLSQWDYDNNDKQPEMVKARSDETAYWKCPKCGYTCPTCHGEYSYRINFREVGDDSCPYCNKGRPLAGYNTLDVTDPVLAKEWSKLNAFKPDAVTKNQNRYVMWTCPECHGDYSYPISKRDVSDESCPYCHKGRLLKGYNSLADKRLDLVGRMGLRQ